MNILHISPINMTIANGLRFSVPGLVSSQNKIEGINVGLLNICDIKKLNEKEVLKFDFEFFPQFRDICDLKKPYNLPDIVVFHGVYYMKYINIYKKLIKKRIPYVIVPRSSLTFGAQKQKYLKKKIGNILYFNKFIYNASKIHYLTENEMKFSKAFRKEYFIVPNGIDIPNEYRKNINENLNITFIGRYDVNHKGLDILIESIKKIRKELANNNVIINLYGSDFRNGKKYLEEKVKEYNLSKSCFINNSIFGEEKKEVLLNTDIFITTSRFEGHPMAVIEAMAYGIPCILTEGTNMTDVMNRYNAGWKADLDPNSVAEIILKSISDKKLIKIKGENARKLVEENYAWNNIAIKTIEEYRKIIKKA